MTKTHLAIATYYLAGGIASAVFAAQAHLGLLFVGMVVAALYVGHLWWMLLQRRATAQGTPTCLTCSQRIGSIRRLSNQRFCSHQHQEQWFDELDGLAVERLQSARPSGWEPGPFRMQMVEHKSYCADPKLTLVLVER